MEPITFEDTLVHDKIKLSEALDYLNTVSAQLNHELDIINASWGGRSAEACRIKLEDLKYELEKVQAALEHSDTVVSEILSLQQAII